MYNNNFFILSHANKSLESHLWKNEAFVKKYNCISKGFYERDARPYK